MKTVLLIPLCLFLAGCATSGSGVRWYAPTTWFSGSEGRDVERAKVRLETSREQALLSARNEGEKALLALDYAPDSKPVELAKQFLENSSVLLGQVLPAPTLEEVSSYRKIVEGLLSENEKIRRSAERLQAEAERRYSAASERVRVSSFKLEQAQKELGVAFERENALANQLRAWQWGLGLTVFLCILLLILAVWWRIQGLGLFSAISRSIKDADVLNLGKQFRSILDVNLTRHEQDMIRKRVNSVL